LRHGFRRLACSMQGPTRLHLCWVECVTPFRCSVQEVTVLLSSFSLFFFH
jgi:hypothetical protein